MRFLAVIFLNIICGSAFATPVIWSGPPRESLGTFSIQDISLRPSYLLHEGGDSQFGIGESSIGLSWQKGEDIGARFRLGSKELITPSARFTDSADINRDFGFVEAYGEANILYGQFRMGLIPLPYGREAQKTEGELILSRPLIYKKRVLPLRDFGASFGVDNGGFYNILAVHHGESDANKDNRMYYTATWGWTDGDVHNVGIMGMAGTTKASATTGSGDTLAGVNPNKEEKWRMGGVFFERRSQSWDVLLEASLGSLIQDNEVTNYATGHLDFEWRFNDLWTTNIRYDAFDPNSSLETDFIQEISLGFSYTDELKTSRFALIATKALEQKIELHNDELRFVWILNPLVTSR
jgi:hypothetical protein